MDLHVAGARNDQWLRRLARQMSICKAVDGRRDEREWLDEVLMNQLFLDRSSPAAWLRETSQPSRRSNRCPCELPFTHARKGQLQHPFAQTPALTDTRECVRNARRPDLETRSGAGMRPKPAAGTHGCMATITQLIAVRQVFAAGWLLNLSSFQQTSKGKLAI